MDGEDLGGQPSPAETVVGSVWEQDNQRSLEEAEVEAAKAKHEYFNHEDAKETKTSDDVAKSGEAPKQEHKEQVLTTEEPKQNESKSGSADDMPVLEVKNEKWMMKHVPKDHDKATAEVKDIPKTLPPKPDCWNKAPCISPEEQCPPKPRGRKPKEKQEEQKGGKSNKKRSRSPAKKDERTKKRGKTTPEPEAEAAEVEVPEPKRKRREKAEPESTKPDPPSKRLRKYLQEAKDPKEERRAKEKEQETKKTNKDKQKMTEKENEKKKKEQKARASRKSSAYHKAFAATEGTEEEKRIAAKKVL